MNVRELHSWDLTPREARRLQMELQHLVERAALSGNVRLVAGVDVHVRRPGPEPGRRRLEAGHCGRGGPLLPRARPCGVRRGRLTVTFPYVPGLLSFREIPPVLEALRMLQVVPDLFLCDGQGTRIPTVRPGLPSRCAYRRSDDRGR
jgi:deoxyribonuclease V